MVRHCPNVFLPYAPEYVEKNLRERHMALFILGHVGWMGNGDEWGLNFTHSSESE